MDVNSEHDSALDLMLVSDNLAGKCEWNIMTQSTIGSDHFPIVVNIGVDITKVEVVRNPRWKFKTAEWGIFKELCQNKIYEINYSDIDVDKLSNKIIDVLRNTAEEVIGKNKSKNRRKAVPWWNEKCSELVCNRNKALRKARKSLVFTDFINYKRAQAIVRREIRRAKKNYWREFCNKIGVEI